jgi:hypothetical protein
MIYAAINPFEYVSILISIILGLGITQILSSYSDLLYRYKEVKFYWPQTLWILFILFLHIQDWFITYQLKEKVVWHLPELIFVLLYPVSLFMATKILLPTNEKEESTNMKLYFFSQFPILFYIVATSILCSVFFNIFLLNNRLFQQTHLLIFLLTMIYVAFKKIDNETIHKSIAITISAVALFSVILFKNEWVIN